MNDRERAMKWLRLNATEHGFCGGIAGAEPFLAAEFAAVRAEERAPLVAALRLAVEAMERMLAYPEVDNFVGTLTYRPMSGALAACRKAVET